MFACNVPARPQAKALTHARAHPAYTFRDVHSRATLGKKNDGFERYISARERGCFRRGWISLPVNSNQERVASQCWNHGEPRRDKQDSLDGARWHRKPLPSCVRAYGLRLSSAVAIIVLNLIFCDRHCRRFPHHSHPHSRT